MCKDCSKHKTSPVEEFKSLGVRIPSGVDSHALEISLSFTKVIASIGGGELNPSQIEIVERSLGESAKWERERWTFLANS